MQEAPLKAQGQKSPPLPALLTYYGFNIADKRLTIANQLPYKGEQSSGLHTKTMCVAAQYIW